MTNIKMIQKILLIFWCQSLVILYAQSPSLVCPELAQAGEGLVLYEGLDGWLFRQVDLKEKKPNKAFVDSARRISEALKEKGVELVVVLVPRKPLIYFDKLNLRDPNQATYSAEGAREVYTTLVEGLRSQGVNAVKLLSAFDSARDRQLFFKIDNHWTSYGAQIAAKAVAEDAVQSVNLQEGERVAFTTVLSQTVAHPSDLVDTLEVACGIKVEPEQLDLFETTRQASDEIGLFDISGGEVVLVGTSFSQRPDAKQDYNFDGFLSQELGLEVLNYAIPGGGAYTALQTYLLDQSYLEQKPKVIIWELPSNMTSQSDLVLVRQIIPSIYGACSQEESLVSSTISLDSEMGILLANITERNIIGAKYYLYIEAQIPLIDFRLRFNYEDDTSEEVVVERSTRGGNFNKFFLALSNQYTANLKEIVMEHNGTLTGQIEGRLCRIKSN